MIADSARAVERGRYPAEALKNWTAVKGMFQLDLHDARIIKQVGRSASPYRPAAWTISGNWPTLEINARINDDPEFKTALYGGTVAPSRRATRGRSMPSPRAIRRSRSGTPSASAASRRSCSSLLLQPTTTTSPCS